MITIGTHGESPVRMRTFEKFSTSLFSDIHSWTLYDLNKHIEHTKEMAKKFDGYNDMCAELIDYYHTIVMYIAGDINTMLNAYKEYKELRTLDCDNERND